MNTLSHPAVSVVLPFYNAEKTLERAARSILAQTFADLELIMVNNNSTDQSPMIARAVAETDARVVLIDEHMQGVSYAANTGNAAARGKYIARMDADDVSLPTRIEKQLALLETNPSIGVASCLVEHVSHHPGTGGISNYVDWANTLVEHEEYA
jgi:glycosyltransferase involved in cell wall biosynthesis